MQQGGYEFGYFDASSFRAGVAPHDTVPTPGSFSTHGYYPESATHSPTIERSVSRSTSLSLSTSVSTRDGAKDSARDGPDPKIRKSKLPSADKRNIELASDLFILDAVLSGKWDNVGATYLIQAGTRTGHSLFHTHLLTTVVTNIIHLSQRLLGTATCVDW